MDRSSPVMVVIESEDDREFAAQLGNSLGYPETDIVLGTPLDAAQRLAATGRSPSYLVVHIGSRGIESLPELDKLAEYCEAGTRVVVIGASNDVALYRELKQRGVIEYFTYPARVADVRVALLGTGAPAGRGGKEMGEVISFMSAASGDGSSTIALGTAFCLANEFRQSTVIVDMDFQFGMLAKNLDLTTPFGIKELFEHPERGIDSTLIAKMLVDYRGNLKVIAAPNDLRLMPDVRPEVIRDLLATLRAEYKYVIIDLPHVWSPWVAAAVSNSRHNVIVAQLWLRSVNHCARILGAYRDIGVERDAVSVVINRSGAKFKEALTTKDFERVSGKTITAHFVNDIKTVVDAENQGKTLLEVAPSQLADNIRAFAASLLPESLRAELNLDALGTKRFSVGNLRRLLQV